MSASFLFFRRRNREKHTDRSAARPQMKRLVRRAHTATLVHDLTPGQSRKELDLKSAAIHLRNKFVSSRPHLQINFAIFLPQEFHSLGPLNVLSAFFDV